MRSVTSLTRGLAILALICAGCGDSGGSHANTAGAGGEPAADASTGGSTTGGATSSAGAGLGGATAGTGACAVAGCAGLNGDGGATAGASGATHVGGAVNGGAANAGAANGGAANGGSGNAGATGANGGATSGGGASGGAQSGGSAGGGALGGNAGSAAGGTSGGAAGAPSNGGAGGGFACTRDADCANAPILPCEIVFCNTSVGRCETTSMADGTLCNDGDACTRTDSCQAGVCKGQSPVVCTAQDQCHVAGLCNSTTGTCSNPNKADASACNDGNACTQTDSCLAGVCKGQNPVVCSPLDQCHASGTCDPASGLCDNPLQADGASCNNGDGCTQTDTCQTGVCTGSNPVVCKAPDQCHVAGLCDAATGLCSNPNKSDGSSCNDQNACTQTDSCQAGVCTGNNPVTCTALDQCHVPGVCNSSTGICSNPNKSDGSSCNDGDGCTQTDSCQTGSCKGSNPVVCAALDQCHVAGLCNSTSGTCSNPNKSNGSACNDGHVCTTSDSCQAGVCTGPSSCSITIAPAALTLGPNQSWVYAATVSGVSPTSVTWSVAEGSPTGGTIVSGGRYTAPTSLSTYHVVATSTVDTGLTASVPVTVTLDPVTVSLCPTTTTILGDDSMKFSALVSGTANQAVTWNASGGTISAAGLFKPSGLGTYTITAQSLAEAAKTGTASASVVVGTGKPNISGIVNYAGSKTGTVHVGVEQYQGGSTAMPLPGAYRIRSNDLGVGSAVNVRAYIDTLGVGSYVVSADPTVRVTIPSWPGTDVTNLNMTLTDPGTVTLGPVPQLMVTPNDGSAVVMWQPLRDSVTDAELPDHYRIYADTTSAVGPSQHVAMVEVRAATAHVAPIRGLTNGQNYWFAIVPVAGSSVGPLTVAGPFSIGVPGGHSISGTFDFAGIAPTGRVFAIAYVEATHAVYAHAYTPSSSTAFLDYSIDGLPDGNYRVGVLMDQDSNDEFGPTDPLTLQHGGSAAVTLAGSNVSGTNIALSPEFGWGTATTRHSTNTQDPYSIDLQIANNRKLPIKATFANGPSSGGPVDLQARYTDETFGLDYSASTYPNVPIVGDRYTLDVMYEDGMVCNLHLSVTGVIADLPQLVSPNGPGTGTSVPLLSWIPPATLPSNLDYELGVMLLENTNSELWRDRPAPSATSVTYNWDGSSSQPSLAEGIGYEWWVRVSDIQGNEGIDYAVFSLPISESAEPNDTTAQLVSQVGSCDNYPGASYAVEGTLETASDVDLFQFHGAPDSNCTADPTVSASAGVRACVRAVCSNGTTTFDGCGSGTQLSFNAVPYCCSDTNGITPGTYGYHCSTADPTADVTFRVFQGTGAYKVLYHF